MRVAIMQPYLFPNLAHFALIACSDQWVVFDVPQYTPKSWMNRNRVLHPTGGWMYITAPVAKAPVSTPICDIRLSDPVGARSCILGKLAHYARKAPFHNAVTELVDRAFSRAAESTLLALNVAGLQEVCHYIELDFTFAICSELQLSPPAVAGPGSWTPAIAEAMGADAYINPIGGRHLFEPATFRQNRIKLSFLEMPPYVYDTHPYTFVPQLSIVDVLMWNTPASVRDALRSARVIDAEVEEA